MTSEENDHQDPTHEDTFYDHDHDHDHPSETSSTTSTEVTVTQDDTGDDLYGGETDDLHKKMQEEQEKREDDIIEGGAGALAKGPSGESPDETKTIMKKDSFGNVIIITTTSAEEPANLKACADYFILSLNSCFRTQKLTAIYAISLLFGIIMLIVLLVRFVQFGRPVTDNAADAYSRMWYSVAICIVISIAAFFILNLSITNLFWGLLWMLLIVSLLYFDLTSLSKASYNLDIAHKKHEDDELFRRVFDYTLRYILKTSPHKFPKYFRQFSHDKQCCDFPCNSKNCTNISVPFGVPGTVFDFNSSMWERLVPRNDMNETMVPAFCIDGEQSLTDTVTKVMGYEESKDRARLTKQCDPELLFEEMKKDMIIVLVFSVLLFILCIFMAFVFWYYYSNIKSTELESTQIPGDYALLYSRLQKPRLHDGVIDRNPKFQLRKEKTRIRVQQMKQRHGGEIIVLEGGDHRPRGPGGNLAEAAEGKAHPDGPKKKKKRKKKKDKTEAEGQSSVKTKKKKIMKKNESDTKVRVRGRGRIRNRVVPSLAGSAQASATTMKRELSATHSTSTHKSLSRNSSRRSLRSKQRTESENQIK